MSTMLKFIVLLAFVGNLNYILADTSPLQEPSNDSVESESFDVDDGKSDTSPLQESSSDSVESETSVEDNSKRAEIKIKCGPNEVYEVCPLTCPPRTCKTKDIDFICMAALKPGDPKCLPPRCSCAYGYYRNDAGKCILKEQCPKPQCKENEEYSQCPNKVCREQTCDQLGFPLPCYGSNGNNTKCGRPACICKEGFVRNKNGICIRKRSCPSCGKDRNAWSGCGLFCNRCTKKVPCPKICRVNSCDCRPGYIYDDINEKCVLPIHCPKCGRLEVYSECANAGCDKRNCSQVAQPDLCIDVVKEACIGACVCKTNYLRNATGQCVPISKCPSKEICPKPHEYYDTCPASCPPRKCGIDDRVIFCVPPSPKDKCNPPSCRCDPGYYRSLSGNCVKFEDCPKCGENEVYDVCPSSCPPRTCETKDRAYKCPAPLQPGDPKCPRPTCRCDEGFYRNSNGKCVLKEECPKCGENEIYDVCPSSCPPRTCETKDRAYKCPAPLQPGDPKCPRPTCRCDAGFYRNSNGKCVSKEQCPKCSDNEVYDVCPSSCPPRTCETKDRMYDCPVPLQPGDPKCPRPRCRCDDGFYRNSNGKCVSREQCPKCGENEIYDVCPSSCPPRTCETKDRVYKCPAPLQPGDPKCPRPTCRCDEGFYRNSYGKCVSKEQCQPKCGPNQVPSECATNGCLPTCAQPDLYMYCDPNPANCRPGCICAPGYLKNKNGVCIPKDKCPPKNSE